MRIETDDLTRPQVHALLAQHLAQMHAQSPACSVHALDIERLRAPGITVWTAWEGDAPESSTMRIGGRPPALRSSLKATRPC